jgi:copper ion binding protein
MKIIFYILVSFIFVAGACTPKQTKKEEIPSVSQTAIRDVTFKVGGMTCDDCEMSIRKGVGELNGIKTIEANHEDSTTHVAFDPSVTSEKEIIAAIEKRGYQVIQND